MAKNVLEGTSEKSYADQTNIVSQFAQNSGVPYQPPKLLEAAICILTEHASRSVRRYSDSPYTFTRCQEKYSNTNYQIGIGGFGAGGLDVCNRYLGSGYGGLCCLRKL